MWKGNLTPLLPWVEQTPLWHQVCVIWFGDSSCIVLRTLQPMHDKLSRLTRQRNCWGLSERWEDIGSIILIPFQTPDNSQKTSSFPFVACHPRKRPRSPERKLLRFFFNHLLSILLRSGLWYYVVLAVLVWGCFCSLLIIKQPWNTVHQSPKIRD